MRIVKGKIKGASKDLIYGVEGVGKTSLASTYPKPLFVDCEGSTVKLDVDRLNVSDYNEFKQAIKLAYGSEDYETIVFDTTDWLENIVINQILKEDNATTITDKKLYSFGAGDKRVEEFFRKNIIPSFNALMKQGKNVVLIAHAHIKGIDDPIVGRYDRYTLKMGKTASSVLKEWVNNVFFINYETYLKKSYGIEKDKATGGKDVFVYTQRTPQFDAKRRDKLNDKIKFIEGKNPYPQIIYKKKVVEPVIEEQKEENTDLAVRNINK